MQPHYHTADATRTSGLSQDHSVRQQIWCNAPPYQCILWTPPSKPRHSRFPRPECLPMIGPTKEHLWTCNMTARKLTFYWQVCCHILRTFRIILLFLLFFYVPVWYDPAVVLYAFELVFCNAIAIVSISVFQVTGVDFTELGGNVRIRFGCISVR